MRIAIGSDHRGCALKDTIMKLLAEKGYSYQDFGCYTEKPVDYPDIAVKVAEAIVRGEFDRGILICSTGIGMCIAANKVKGIRAAQVWDAFTAQRARAHNDAQICCLSAEEGKVRVPAILEKFLTTEFEGGRHIARINKIKEIEDKYYK
ncbi:MAG: ribose 5-phosphate isomerase B [Dehalococcoidales bacterium]